MFSQDTKDQLCYTPKPGQNVDADSGGTPSVHLIWRIATHTCELNEDNMNFNKFQLDAGEALQQEGKQLAQWQDLTVRGPCKAPKEGWQGVVMKQSLLLWFLRLACQLWIGWALDT